LLERTHFFFGGGNVESHVFMIPKSNVYQVATDACKVRWFAELIVPR
jgi:hypothetical protein